MNILFKLRLGLVIIFPFYAVPECGLCMYNLCTSHKYSREPWALARNDKSCELVTVAIIEDI